MLAYDSREIDLTVHVQLTGTQLGPSIRDSGIILDSCFRWRRWLTGVAPVEGVDAGGKLSENSRTIVWKNGLATGRGNVDLFAGPGFA